MKSITPGQIEQFSRFVEDASGPSTRTALEQLKNDGEINQETLQVAIEEGSQLKPRLIRFLKTMIKEMSNSIHVYVKSIFIGEKITIAKTNGEENLANAKDLFGFIDPDFVKYGCDVKSKPAEETPIEMVEVVEDGIFEQFFGSFNVDLDQLCLTQHQIKVFVKDHRDKLCTDGYDNFFLLKENEQFFVVNVSFSKDRKSVKDNKIGVRVYTFSCKFTYRAEHCHRIVVPVISQVKSK
ncbi:MAG: hypothetical protein WC666_01530 [Candidatus Paceibacterota bacterium]|jgi:hypothetical protein